MAAEEGTAARGGPRVTWEEGTPRVTCRSRTPGGVPHWGLPSTVERSQKWRRRRGPEMWRLGKEEGNWMPDLGPVPMCFDAATCFAEVARAAGELILILVNTRTERSRNVANYQTPQILLNYIFGRERQSGR